MLENVITQRNGLSLRIGDDSGGSSRHVLPSSSLTIRGIQPCHLPGKSRGCCTSVLAAKTHSRSFPAGSTIRYRLGQFLKLTKFGGSVSSSRFQVRPPSSLRAIGPAWPPWPMFQAQNIVLPSASSAVVGWA